MNSEEKEVYEFLKLRPNRFVRVAEISKELGARQDFCRDRNWMTAILRRMEIEGWVEASPKGGYRLMHQPDETTSFKKAIETPGTPLGDTEIVSLAGTPGGRVKAA